MGRGKSLSKDGSIAPPGESLVDVQWMPCRWSLGIHFVSVVAGSSHLFVPRYPLDACVARTIDSIAARDFRLVLVLHQSASFLICVALALYLMRLRSCCRHLQFHTFSYVDP